MNKSTKGKEWKEKRAGTAVAALARHMYVVRSYWTSWHWN